MSKLFVEKNKLDTTPIGVFLGLEGEMEAKPANSIPLTIPSPPDFIFQIHHIQTLLLRHQPPANSTLLSYLSPHISQILFYPLPTNDLDALWDIREWLNDK